jgi:hypothetical protein
MTAPIRALVARQREAAAVDTAVDRLRWLLAEQAHQVDTADTAFAALACEHPDACTKPADYPAWTPPHLEAS